MMTMTIHQSLELPTDIRLMNYVNRMTIQGQSCTVFEAFVGDDLIEVVAVHPQNTVMVKRRGYKPEYGEFFEGFNGRRIRLHERALVFDVENPRKVVW
jgi:hypothetical protein